jgi:hypothetical protein
MLAGQDLMILLAIPYIVVQVLWPKVTYAANISCLAANGNGFGILFICGIGTHHYYQ